ncbi:divalent-cation tolerance protein CutA [Methanosarcina mazei]|uniref:Periplasmic divalent cation tolerance protein CutA n=2 Tax=Methanosarcina mazei TaxID=2209 RepID=A0A0E3RIG3_METMZ|nr:divalent cation tolerance protein CutA [Methanosarcina mazei]AAM32706.1 Periplasmic divalent cation tolerance protein [Methanosarcina mazei Go1]AKB64867.1 Periplasmic divalent cation tolerance protein CutA [Methanosarcina mazei S-6]WIM42926.1 divalent cation tolerance protein CutA [Methanosarcina mazei]WIM46386.1 divalent cation tolerance protein CutA [Methanosarcina mazei]
MIGIVYITAGSMDNASEIARELVARRLAACVNMFPIYSIYRWNEKVEEQNEVALFAKTDSSRLEEIIETVRFLHTYDLPAIEFWEVKGEQNYLDWVHVNSS